MSRRADRYLRRLAVALAVVVVVGSTVFALSPVVPPVGAVDPTPTPSAAPSPAPAPTPPDASPRPSMTSTPSPDPDPDPVPSPSPRTVPGAGPIAGTVRLTADQPGSGRRRIAPASVVTVSLIVTAEAAMSRVTVVESLPAGWTLVRSGDGTYAAGDRTISWRIADIDRGTIWRRSFSVRAPSPVAGTPLVVDSTFAAWLTNGADVIGAPALVLRVAPVLVVENVVLAELEDANGQPAYARTNGALEDAANFDRIRVRFQVRNADRVAASFLPVLQYRVGGMTRFVDVPAGQPELDIPVYLAREWRDAGTAKPGAVLGPNVESIAGGDLRIRERDDATQLPAAGRRFMGSGPEDPVKVAGDTYTEIEFTLRTTVDMPFGRTIELRLTDDGAPIDGAVVGVIRTMARPALTLSPGQRRGVDVAGPVDDQDLEPPVPTPAPAAPRDATAEIRDDVDYALVPPAAIVDARTALATSVPQYRLAVAQPSDTDAPGPLGAPFDSPHVPDSSLVADTCARCHSGHVGQGPMLLPDPNPQASLCMSCHDGTSGSVIDIAGQYAGAPTNDATTRSYYRHDALAPSVHTLDGDDEFGGVLERHSECGDCHNPHRAVDTDAIQMTTGWTVSGRQEGLSGVSIGNGAVGTPPTYTFLDGTPGSQPTREYEICLKCHSGFTVLPSNEGQPPSRYALDKGIDLNPDNASYHPIAAPGKNGTTTMANSLGGTSPYKLWDFTTGSTVRCVNCHGDPAKATVADPPTPGGALAPHASENRGLLLQPYRDRTLKIAGEPYDAAEFALCYVCHAEAPFLNIGTGMTSFDLHALHLSDLPGGSGGLDIDTPGAGQGYATCAECHFRLHSTAGAVNAGDRDNSRLVNFAPNVQPTSGGVLEWTKVGAGGTCTLTCHGAPHNGFDY